MRKKIKKKETHLPAFFLARLADFPTRRSTFPSPRFPSPRSTSASSRSLLLGLLRRVLRFFGGSLGSDSPRLRVFGLLVDPRVAGPWLSMVVL
jgi:hypothetical protein